MITLAFVIFAFAYVKTQTTSGSEGCLSHSKTTPTDCVACDSLMDYVLEQSRCIRNSIPNCQLTFQNGWCKLCKYGYFLDGAFKCSPVQTDTFIELKNCNNYLDVNRCLVCNLNSYLRNGVCRPTTQRAVRGCSINANEKTCATCNLLLPTRDGKKCKPVPGTSFNKCLFFRHPLVCSQCKPGFKKDPNYLLLNIHSQRMFRAFVFQLKFWKNNYFSIVHNTPSCIVSNTISNCDQLDFGGLCKKCKLGFTLNPSRTSCFVEPRPPANPTHRILNCYIFETQNYERCQICYEGFYLNNAATACIKIQNLVPNCLIHSQTQTDTCLYCDNEYFLDTTQIDKALSCQKRFNNPTNCAVFERIIDKCISCYLGTKPHGPSANKICSPLISNCQEYITDQTVLKCSKCNDGYYTDTNQINCINANNVVSNCKEYGSAAACLVCNTSFYLSSNGQCLQQPVFNGCKTLSLTVRARCDECLNQAINSAVLDECKQVQVLKIIPNCIRYNANEDCAECKTDWFIYNPATSSPSCIQLTGCTALEDVTNSSRCGKCSGNPYFLWDGACRTADVRKKCVYDFQLNSTSSTFQMTIGFPCQICSANNYYIAEPPTARQVCNTFNFGSKCLTYRLTSTLYSSVECSRCFRNYNYPIGSTTATNCVKDDVLFSGNASVNAYNLTSMDHELNLQVRGFEVIASTQATMFPFQTFPVTQTWQGVSTVTGQATTYCFQLNQAKDKCLACKFYFPAYYVADSWDKFLASDNLQPHKRWLYQYTSNDKRFDEQKFDTSSPPVTACRIQGIENPIAHTQFSNAPAAAGGTLDTDPLRAGVGKNFDTFEIGEKIYHRCLFGHNLDIWTIDATLQTATLKMESLSSSNYPLGWGNFVTQATRAGWLSDTQKLYNATCNLVGAQNQTASSAVNQNCVLLQNNTNIHADYKDRFSLTCAKCADGHQLVTEWLWATVSFYKTDIYERWENSFGWMVTKCIPNASIPSMFAKPNCYYYNITNLGGRLYYECKACSPGSRPTTGLQPFQCNITGPWADSNQPDNCRETVARCNKYLKCEAVCNPTCGTDQFCNQVDGQCKDLACPTCSSSDPKCRLGANNCPRTSFCNWGDCLTKCDCESTDLEYCSEKTNFRCLPKLSSIYSGLSVWQREYDVIREASMAGTNSSAPTYKGTCAADHILEGWNCLPLRQCPNCLQNQYCEGLRTVGADGAISYSYSCKNHADCEKCVGTQYCHATFNFLDGASTIVGCKDYPQFTFTEDFTNCASCIPCIPTCLTGEDCVNGICIRRMFGVCSWGISETAGEAPSGGVIPIYCEATKTCYQKKCYDFEEVGPSKVLVCNCGNNEACWDFQCYTLSQCPACPRGEYCGARKPSSTTYQYFCVPSAFCATQCTGTQWCHSFYNFTNTQGVATFDRCQNYPQFTFADPFGDANSALPACTPECSTDQQCVGGNCIPNFKNMCNWSPSKKYALVCKPTEVCVDGFCIDVTAAVTTAFETICTEANSLFYNNICYTNLLTDCKICPRNSYCKGTKSGTSHTYSCEPQTEVTCKGTQYLQSTYNYATGVTTPGACGDSPQWTFPYPGSGCDSCTACTPSCTAGFICVRSACIPVLTGVCSFRNNIIPVFCNRDQVCVNDVCQDTITLGSSFITSCGAVPGKSICINKTAWIFPQCPFCNKNEYCHGTRNTDGSHSFECRASATCKCTQFKWCHSTFDWQSTNSVSSTCVDYPQLIHTTASGCSNCGTCSTACQAEEDCANGTCIRRLKRVCGFAFERTVPVICADNQLCLNGVCYTAEQYSQSNVATLGTSCPGIYVNGVCVITNQCSLCPSNKFCKQSWVSGNTYTYDCIYVSQCDTCQTNGQFCWGSYDFFPSLITTSAFLECKDYPQFEMSWTKAVPAWTYCSCTGSEQCVNGVCLPLLNDICFFSSTNIPIKCEADENCVSNSCQKDLEYYTQTIVSAGCNYGQIIVGTGCVDLTVCPLCLPGYYCHGEQIGGNNVFSCKRDRRCDECSTQVSQVYCKGTYNWAGTGDVDTSGTTPCTNVLPLSVPSTSAQCPTCNSCSSCTGTCLNGICVADLTSVYCGFEYDNSTPFKCDSSLFCYDEKCWNRNIFTTNCANVKIGYYCNNVATGAITRLVECPICSRNEYCKVTASGASAPYTYTYTCEFDTNCSTCTGIKWCTKTYDYSTNSQDSAVTCVDYVPFVLQTTTRGSITTTCSGCSNPPAPATPTKVCSFSSGTGVCLDVFTNVCYFTNGNTIPVFCQGKQKCENSQCVDNYAAWFVDNGALTSFTVAGSLKAYDVSNKCPLCPKGTFCKANVPASGPASFTCDVSTSCNCSELQRCQGNYDPTFGTSGRISDAVCANKIQYFPSTYFECGVCSSCSDTQLCYTSNCRNKASRVLPESLNADGSAKTTGSTLCDAECIDPNYCVDGNCVAPSNNVLACPTCKVCDTVCATDETCVNGVCIKLADNPVFPCTSCASGQICVDGTCEQVSDYIITETGSDVCKDGCKTNQLCRAGTCYDAIIHHIVHATENTLCDPLCSGNTYCYRGKCVGIRSNLIKGANICSGPCDPGEYCDGTCKSWTYHVIIPDSAIQCTSCKAGEVCAESKCYPFTGQHVNCGDDCSAACPSTCPDDQLCYKGVCKEVAWNIYIYNNSVKPVACSKNKYWSTNRCYDFENQALDIPSARSCGATPAASQVCLDGSYVRITTTFPNQPTWKACSTGCSIGHYCVDENCIPISPRIVVKDGYKVCDSVCSNLEICVNTQCRPYHEGLLTCTTCTATCTPPCTDTATSVCLGGTCIPSNLLTISVPNFKACALCPAGQLCMNGNCVVPLTNVLFGTGFKNCPTICTGTDVCADGACQSVTGTNVACDVSKLCSPVCGSGMECVGGECFPTLTNVCGINDSGQVVVCAAEEECVNQSCKQKFKLGDLEIVDCGCAPGFICIQRVCYRLTQCPVCKPWEYCHGALSSERVVYTCKLHDNCKNCRDGQWCQATYDFSTQAVTVTGCGNSPQLSFPCTATPGSVNCNSCTSCISPNVCINGVCRPPLTTVCSFAFWDTVPVICSAGQSCRKGVCFNGGGGSLTGCPDGQVLIVSTCKERRQCPACKRNEYCHATNNLGVVTYECKASPLCTCTGTKYCQATWDYRVGTSSVVVSDTSTRCGDSPQWTFPYSFPATNPVTPCSETCGNDQQCISGQCIDNIRGICDTYNKAPVICHPNEVCVNQNCRPVTMIANKKIVANLCKPRLQFGLNEVCYNLLNCPVCDHTEYCTTSSTYPMSYECSSPNNECSGCSDTHYCHSQFNVATNTTTPASTVCGTVPQWMNVIPTSSNGSTSNRVANNYCGPSVSAGSRFGSSCTISSLSGTILLPTSPTTVCPCVPNLEKVCGWTFRNTVPIFCEADEMCVNHACYKKNGIIPWNFASGCPMGHLRTGGKCYPLAHCPICKQNEICNGQYISDGVYKFNCVANSQCNCLGTQYCQGVFGWGFKTESTTTGACADSPTYTFINSPGNCKNTICRDCTPVCENGSDCVNGICIPKLTGVCYYAANGTVPVTCWPGTGCMNQVCMPANKYGAVEVIDCGCTSGQICYQQKCYTRTYYTKCPPTQYAVVTIAGTAPSCTYTTSCSTNAACAACTGDKICLSKFNTGGTQDDPSNVPENIRCSGNTWSPVYTLDPAGTETETCQLLHKRCGTEVCLYPKVCLNGNLCVDGSVAPFNADLVCFWDFRDTVAVACPAGSTCNAADRMCYNDANPKINEAGCPPGNISVRGTCYKTSMCPVCSNNQYCHGTRTDNAGTITYSFACQTHTRCSTCTNDKYCQSTFDFSSGTNTVPGICQDYPQLGFNNLTGCNSCTTCAPACTNGYCIDGVCVPYLLKVCSWRLNNLVPVFCGRNETCLNGVCYPGCQPRCNWNERCVVTTTSSTCVTMDIHEQKTIITGCAAVTNCGISTQFSRQLNQCNRCADLYAWEKKADDSINMDLCLQVPTFNCLHATKNVGSTEANPQNTCVECYPGYVLEAGSCFAAVTGCTYADAAGKCQACDTDYSDTVPYIADGFFETGKCEAVTVRADIDTPYSGSLDQNCEYFSLYYPTGLTPPVNLSAGKNVCIKCKTNFFMNDKFACIEQTINNCDTHDVTSTNILTKCKTCASGYRLNGDATQCLRNEVTPAHYVIPECLDYSPTYDCVKCNDGWMVGGRAINTFNQQKFCFKNTNPDINCIQNNLAYFATNAQIECTHCKDINSGYAYPFRTSQPNYLCVDIAPFSQCIKQDANFNDRTLQCLRCIDSYYVVVSTQQCTPRTTYPIVNCKTYTATADTCEEFFAPTSSNVDFTNPLPVADQLLVDQPPIKPIQTIIVDYQGWIMGCQIYESPTQCARCYPHRYHDPFGLEYNTKCIPVTTVVENCSLYSDKGAECLECQKFYRLVNGACELIIAINCATYETSSKCATCPTNYPKMVNGNCEIDYSNPWCLHYQNTLTPDVFLCQTCQENYYPNDSGICQRVHIFVANCQYYQFDGYCAQCFQGYYLEVGGERCLKNPPSDPDCLTFVDGTECSVCEFGYYISNGVCTKCGTPATCAYCDPNDATKCILCQFGHSMQADGSCTPNPLRNATEVFFYNYNWISSSGSSSTPAASSRSNFRTAIDLGVSLMLPLSCLLLGLLVL